MFINDRVFQLWKGSIFLPLAFIDAQTPSLQKPVSALTPKKRFHDEVLKAKIRARSRSFFLRREQLKVEGRRRENELGAAELQELSEVRKGHQHSLPNMEIARIRATNKRHPFPIQDIQSGMPWNARLSRKCLTKDTPSPKVHPRPPRLCFQHLCCGKNVKINPFCEIE
jgi:hypothetical protein